MKFDDLDKQMRVYETAHDHCVLPGMYIVARLDGRSFTKLTKETIPFERPFDLRFSEAMTSVTEFLMAETGFSFLYGYTESDEISLLFSAKNVAFKNKTRKLNSVLAGSASSEMTVIMSEMVEGSVNAVFDCRLSQLPRRKDVVDYFRWRMADSERNSLNSWAYWTLRKSGRSLDELRPGDLTGDLTMSARQATAMLEKASVSDKHDLLMSLGINYNDLPAWQKRGVGVYWEAYEKTGVNPKTSEEARTVRRRLVADRDLPMGDRYSAFIREFVPPMDELTYLDDLDSEED